MDTCDALARIGYAALLADLGDLAVQRRIDDDPSVAQAARLADHRRVHAALIASAPRPQQYGDGATWIRAITWPERVPGLVTWAGRSSLPHIIAAHQRRLADVDPATDPFDAVGVYRPPQEGPSGIDARTCQDARDIGFSPRAIGMPTRCRPAVELLAILGLETVPLVSYDYRSCGFVADGTLWRFCVEARAGGYYHRWGPLHRYQEAY